LSASEIFKNYKEEDDENLEIPEKAEEEKLEVP
jgi:hypothetical protein